MTRQEIYRGFLDTFATGKYPFEASIENDKLVLYWLWQDILSYGVIRHTEAFKCEVELFDDGTYKRHDMILNSKLMHEPLKQYLESCGLTARKIEFIE